MSLLKHRYNELRERKHENRIFGRRFVLKWTWLPLTGRCIGSEKGILHFIFTEIDCPDTGPDDLKFITDSLPLFGLNETFPIAKSEVSMWGDAMPHEKNEFPKKVSSILLKNNYHRLCNKINNVWQHLFVYLQSIKATRAYLRLVYSCNCRHGRIQSSPKAGIGYLLYHICCL